MDPLTITPAAPEEYEWCARLMASNEPWVTLGRGYAESLAAVSHPEYVILLARRGGQRLGFIRIHPRGVAGSPYIASVAVEQANRGEGLGTALVAHAEGMYKAQARFIFLCVSSFNTRARELYERLGYTVVNELKDYVRDGLDETLMLKRLA